MNVISRARILKHVVKYRLTWNRKDTYYQHFSAHSNKFMSPRGAIKLINDDDTVIVCGIGGNQRISILSWALKEIYEESKHPANLTLISAAGHGGRGKAPGTLEEWAVDGLLKEFICAHFETYKAILALADQGKLSLQCIPLGILALLVKAAANGQYSMSSKAGVGTFCDPRVGIGSSVLSQKSKLNNLEKEKEGLISVVGDQLRYRIPKIDIAIFNAPAADTEGNIYIENCSTICESKEAALAARKNGGKVIVNVGKIVEKNSSKVFLSAEEVDAIVYYPATEQTAMILHSDPLMFLTENSHGDVLTSLAKVKWMNRIAGITPKRGSRERQIAYQCADLIHQYVGKGSYVNIGTGLPELVCETLQKRNLLENYTLFTEAGAVGGIPAPGMFFGAAIAPKKIISSPEVFELANENLEATVLGFLQVDSEGNVNASKRGDGAMNYVGPGGFIDLSCAAKNIFFVGSWMIKGRVSVNRNITRIKRLGKPKFIDQVDQITFSGKEAINAGKNVFYITDVGTFKLTDKGMMLVDLRVGVNLQKDILEFSPMKIMLKRGLKIKLQ